jgi:hypothetical protein
MLTHVLNVGELWDPVFSTRGEEIMSDISGFKQDNFAEEI